MPSTETAFRMTLIILGLAAIFWIREVYYPIRIPTGSMKPAIRPGERILVRRMNHSRAVRRGDILVFRSTHRQKGDGRLLMIKRVIGLPGELVEFHSGLLHINGVCHAEPYLTGNLGEDHRFIVPTGSFLFLGDNRPASHDARYWADPYVRGHEIVGRAQFRIWPLNRLGPIQ